MIEQRRILANRCLAALCYVAVATLFAPASAAPLDLVKTAAKSGAVVDHAAWSKLLKTYVTPGRDGLNRVDYAAWKRDGHAALKAYVKTLESVDPRSLSRSGQFAYLANLYNAKTIDVVLDAYPVASIKDISLGGGLVAAFTGGPWKAKVIEVAGESLSFDDIEHGILRPHFKDPRVHYAVNCASVGCPNLGTEAFTAENLDDMLNAGARAYINHPRGAAVRDGELTVSSIYRWFEADFGGSEPGVIKHLRMFAAEPLSAKLKGIAAVRRDTYDWSLNDVAR